MFRQILSIVFGVESFIALVMGVVIYAAVRHYQKANRTIVLSHLITPANNVVLILTLLVPILMGIAGYFYSSVPNSKYPSLVSSIFLLFIVLLVSIWESFAILGLAKDQEHVTLKMPEDRAFITGMGLMYSLLPLAIVYLAIFLLFEVPQPKNETIDIKATSTTYYISKPMFGLGVDKDTIVSFWGKPDSFDQANKVLIYNTNQSRIQLYFDDNWKLKQIQETRS